VTLGDSRLPTIRRREAWQRYVRGKSGQVWRPSVADTTVSDGSRTVPFSSGPTAVKGEQRLPRMPRVTVREAGRGCSREVSLARFTVLLYREEEGYSAPAVGGDVEVVLQPAMNVGVSRP